VRLLAFLAVALAAWLPVYGASDARALERNMFGWRSAEVAGARPLLVIWLRDESGTPPAELAKFHRYYEDTTFGPSTIPGQLDRFEPNVVGYFREVSRGKFGWTKAGLIGPLTAPIKGKPADEIVRLALSASAREGRFDFRPFDADHDGRLSSAEIGVLVITGPEAAGWQVRDFAAAERNIAIANQNLAFAGRVTVIDENAGFATVIRALLRMIAPDSVFIGGWPQKCFALNNSLSPMAAASAARQIVHLDPWHKMLLGWIEPRVYAVGAPGTAKLVAQHVGDYYDPAKPLLTEGPDRHRPVLLYDGMRGPSDFILLEYRTRSRLGYDQDTGTSGLVIWQVALDGSNRPFMTAADRKNCKGETLEIPSVFVRGARDWTLGASRAYTAGDGPIPLRWIDGTDSGVRLSVSPHNPADWQIEVTWSRSIAAKP
jgi:hypothetical protein